MELHFNLFFALFSHATPHHGIKILLEPKFGITFIKLRNTLRAFAEKVPFFVKEKHDTLFKNFA